MSAPAAMAVLADIRDIDFESAWIYTLSVFGATVVSGYGVWQAVRQLSAMWRAGDRTLAVAVGSFVGVTTLLLLSILVTLIVNFLSIANGPGGTP